MLLIAVNNSHCFC